MVALQYTETKYLLKVSEAANMLGLSRLWLLLCSSFLKMLL